MKIVDCAIHMTRLSDPLGIFENVIENLSTYHSNIITVDYLLRAFTLSFYMRWKEPMESGLVAFCTILLAPLFPENIELAL